LSLIVSDQLSVLGFQRSAVSSQVNGQLERQIRRDDYQACSGDCLKSAEGASYTSMGRSPMDDRPNRIRGPKARSIPSGNERAAHQRPSIGPAGASLRIIKRHFGNFVCPGDAPTPTCREADFTGNSVFLRTAPLGSQKERYGAMQVTAPTVMSITFFRLNR
jgi:hypothetical protein